MNRCESLEKSGQMDVYSNLVPQNSWFMDHKSWIFICVDPLYAMLCNCLPSKSTSIQTMCHYYHIYIYNTKCIISISHSTDGFPWFSVKKNTYLLDLGFFPLAPPREVPRSLARPPPRTIQVNNGSRGTSHVKI